jgi:hypothetical protein
MFHRPHAVQARNADTYLGTVGTHACALDSQLRRHRLLLNALKQPLVCAVEVLVVIDVGLVHCCELFTQSLQQAIHIRYGQHVLIRSHKDKVQGLQVARPP